MVEYLEPFPFARSFIDFDDYKIFDHIHIYSKQKRQLKIVHRSNLQ